jgi:hypothetical protein
MHQLVKVQLVVDIFQFCSGAVQTDVHGMHQLAQSQMRMGI